MEQPTAAAPVSVPAAPSVGSEGAAPAAEPVPAASISPPAADPDTAPLPPLGAAAAQPAVVGGTPHRESEEPAALALTASEPAAAATSPGPAADPAPAPGSDELPPLPADLSRAAGAASPVQIPAAAPPAAELPAPAPPAVRSSEAGADRTRRRSRDTAGGPGRFDAARGNRAISAPVAGGCPGRFRPERGDRPGAGADARAGRRSGLDRSRRAGRHRR